MGLINSQASSIEYITSSMKYSLTVLALLCALYTCAQEKIIYLDTSGNPVKEREALLLEQRVKRDDTCWEINRYAIDGPRITSRQFLDEEYKQIHGRYIVYGPSGSVDTVGKYLHGLRDGRWFVFSPDGIVLRQLIYRNDSLIRNIDTIEIRKEIKRYNDSLKRGGIEVIDSRFPAGVPAWMQFINRNVTYPKRAFKKGIEGIPMVYFTIDKDGSIDPVNTYIQHSVEYTIDKEALRVICSSPRWTIATINHKPVRSFKSQKIVFKLTPV